MLVKRYVKKLPFARPVIHWLKLKRSSRGLTRDPAKVFTKIYRRRFWRGEDSASGPGSDDDQTIHLRSKLPELLRDFEISSILDIPCGDYHWMKNVDLGNIDYIGADIVQDLIEANRRYESSRVRFFCLDLLTDSLPKSDLVLVRDCLVHLSYQQIFAALQTVRESECRYLLTTTFPEADVNFDITTGRWRPLNLQAPPFCLPPPLIGITEAPVRSGRPNLDKALALWRVSDIPVPRT